MDKTNELELNRWASELPEYDATSPCPKCGEEMQYRPCSGLGCEEGEYLDEDGINGDSYQRCDECNGKGYEEWCSECGWDDVFQRFLSPAYEQEWLAKRTAPALTRVQAAKRAVENKI